MWGDGELQGFSQHTVKDTGRGLRQCKKAAGLGEVLRG